MTRETEEPTREMQDLASSEDRLRAIYESEPECVKLLSRDMILLEMNPAGLAMVEADQPLDAIGKDVSLLVDEVDGLDLLRPLLFSHLFVVGQVEGQGLDPGLAVAADEYLVDDPNRALRPAIEVLVFVG